MEQREAHAAIRDACQHFKNWLQQRPYPECNTTDHLLRHPLEPQIMVMGMPDPAMVAEFHYAVWTASMNSDNMPRLTVVSTADKANTAELLSQLEGLPPGDRVHHDSVVNDLSEVVTESQAAVFLPFTLDASDDDQQANLLQDLRAAVVTNGIVMVVSRMADRWKETAQRLGYRILDDTPSKKDPRLTVITLEKQQDLATGDT